MYMSIHHSGGMWGIWWQIRPRIRHRIRLGRMTYCLKPGFLAFFCTHHFICLSYLPNSTLSLSRHSIFHRICQIFLSIEHVILSSIVPALFSFFPNTSFLSSNVSASRTPYRLSFYISLDKYITYEQPALIFPYPPFYLPVFS